MHKSALKTFLLLLFVPAVALAAVGDMTFDPANSTITATSSDGLILVEGPDGRLGYVCDDIIDNGTALTNALIVAETHFGAGSSCIISANYNISPSNNFILDDVNCNGTESSWIDCSHTTLFSHNCAVSEAFGLNCMINNAADQTITSFTSNPATGTYASTATLSATASSGLTVTQFASTTATICSVGTNTVFFLSPGTCNVTADQVGNAAFNPAPQVNIDITVGKATQTISGFTASPASGTYNGSSTLSAFTDAYLALDKLAGLTITYGRTAGSSAVCSVSGNIVIYIGTGTCTVTADQSGDTNYNAATQVTLDIPVAKLDQTISNFTATPASGLFEGSSTLSAISDAYSQGEVKIAGLEVTDFGSLTSSICTVNGNVVSFIAVGTCAVSADQAGDENYNAATQVTLDIIVDAIVPDAPVITNIEPGFMSLAVSFDPPESDGGSPVTNYLVDCDGYTANGTGSPIVVENVPNGTSYSCTVTAENSAGQGAPSSADGTAIPAFPVPTLSYWAQLIMVLSLMLIMFGFAMKVRN